jgi:plasmid stabilization system protein ParE
VRIEYHPSVEHDLADALQTYDTVSQKLGDEFQAELRRVITLAADNPGRFHLIKPGFHRANLRRFPYHFIYRRLPDRIRVTLVRHHRRHPDLGMDRL